MRSSFSSPLLRILVGALTLLFCLALSRADSEPDKLEQNMLSRFGEDGAGMLRAWRRLLDEGHDLSDPEKLEKVNNFFNQHIGYRDDIDLWQKSDYWATPMETLGTRFGDCEDYTIAKYMTLIKLGIPVERLRLIYVRAQIGGGFGGNLGSNYSNQSQAHMVLGYYDKPTAIPVVLDNLVSQIQPASARTDLKPVFSFNSQGLWVGNSTQSQADPTARLSRWRDLLNRMQAEGFYEN